MSIKFYYFDKIWFNYCDIFYNFLRLKLKIIKNIYIIEFGIYISVYLIFL